MADSVTAAPEEARPEALEPPRESALGLLRQRDFRLTYTATATSEFGDAFQCIALSGSRSRRAGRWAS